MAPRSKAKAAEPEIELPDVKPRYEVYADWYESQFGRELDPLDIQLVVTNHKRWQESDECREFNESRQKEAKTSAKAAKDKPAKTAAPKRGRKAAAAEDEAPDETEEAPSKGRGRRKGAKAGTAAPF
jgi:hypothetical protein